MKDGSSEGLDSGSLVPMKYLASCTFALTLLLWDSPFCAAAETFDSKGVKISYSVHGKGTW